MVYACGAHGKLSQFRLMNKRDICERDRKSEEERVGKRGELGTEFYLHGK